MSKGKPGVSQRKVWLPNIVGRGWEYRAGASKLQPMDPQFWMSYREVCSWAREQVGLTLEPCHWSPEEWQTYSEHTFFIFTRAEISPGQRVLLVRMQHYRMQAELTLHSFLLWDWALLIRFSNTNVLIPISYWSFIKLDDFQPDLQ